MVFCISVPAWDIWNTPITITNHVVLARYGDLPRVYLWVELNLSFEKWFKLWVGSKLRSSPLLSPVPNKSLGGCRRRISGMVLHKKDQICAVFKSLISKHDHSHFLPTPPSSSLSPIHASPAVKISILTSSHVSRHSPRHPWPDTRACL